MARPLRVEFSGAFYHVISRGNSGEPIFKTGRDKEKFLEYVKRTHELFSLVIHTYCLMANHYHLLVETPQANLSSSIQWLNVSYATFFNKKHGRNGHLFQGRFKALLVDADAYLKQLCRYIHLNPVRAGLVPTPSAYHWSSYSAFIGKTRCPKFLTTDWLFSNFGGKKKKAMKCFQDFVESADINTLEDPHAYLTGGFLLGRKDFVEWVRETFLSAREDEKEIPQLKLLKPRVSPERILQQICRESDCSEEQVRAPGRKNNKARKLAIYLARELSGKTCAELGMYFGGVSGPLITMISNRVAGERTRDRGLDTRIENLKKGIFNI